MVEKKYLSNIIRGVHIENIYVKNIAVDGPIQDALSVAATERRLAEGKIISAKADVQSAKLLKEAADALDSNAAMQIRYLDTIKTICNTPNTSMVFMNKPKNKKNAKKK